MDFTRPVEAVVPGAQGRVLAVLAETTAELNLRTVAELSGVSQAQVSRVLPGLVRLGVLERREVPPASLFRFVPEHVASRAIVALARAGDQVVEELGQVVAAIPVSPVSVVVFGSFARREAGAESDIDLLVVRAHEVDEDDERWVASIDQLQTNSRRLAGNRFEVLEVAERDVASLIEGRRQVWIDIRRDHRLVYGSSLDELRASARV